jgi:NADH dehydrogenase
LLAARGLGGDLDVTLVDRENYFLFQPLAYQVATGSLSSVEVAAPLRQVLRRHKRTHVLLGEVTGFDLAAHRVVVEHLPNGEDRRELEYDVLVVAGGSRYSYFGHADWAEYAPELKSLDGALALRDKVLSAFEAAEVEHDPVKRDAFLTFVVVGAGPTGVEMAGQIGELARDTLRHDFRTIDPKSARILLVEAADRVLTSFSPKLSAKAERSLERLGVTVMTSSIVTSIDAGGVTVGDERIAARTVVWAAGVTASGLAGRLAELSGAELDRVGRITVEPDLTLPGHPEVFALGDMVRVRGANGVTTLPGVAPVAMQQGRYAAGVVRKRLEARESRPFAYRDKGNLATIGRGAAVADIKGLQLSGLIAWLTWLLVHLFYLIGFQNRLLVFIRWSTSFATHGRGARLITQRVAD